MMEDRRQRASEWERQLVNRILSDRKRITTLMKVCILVNVISTILGFLLGTTVK